MPDITKPLPVPPNRVKTRSDCITIRNPVDIAGEKEIHFAVEERAITSDDKYVGGSERKAALVVPFSYIVLKNFTAKDPMDPAGTKTITLNGAQLAALIEQSFCDLKAEQDAGVKFIQVNPDR
jgi:hypothetical protein